MENKQFTIDQILNAIENIYTFVNNEDNKYGFNKVVNNKEETRSVEVLSKSFEFTPGEAVFFSVIFMIQINDHSRISLKRIARTINIPVIELFKLYGVIDQLNKKGFITVDEGRDEELYKIKQSIFKQILRQTIPEVTKTEMTIFSLAQSIVKLIRHSRHSSGLKGHDFIYAYEDLFDDYAELNELKELESIGLSIKEAFIFLFIAFNEIVDESSVNISSVIEKLFPEVNDLLRFKRRLLKGNTNLIFKKLIVLESGHFMGGDSYVLGEKGKDIMDVLPTKTNKDRFKSSLGKVLIPDEISKVDLYYNEREDTEIVKIKSLLKKTNYKKCLTRLKKMNMSQNVSVLLFGGPGTGKTELVKQLAKHTDRKIFMVDMSSVKDKFVGESEKRVSKIFSDYQRLKKMEDLTPILLFNESDALMNKRISANNSVDHMSNAMQNIFLQHLEDFEGILMATSNMVKNLDKAFERRFLLKLKIDSPDEKNRAKIFKNRFKDLSSAQIKKLAKKYKVTGAQIGNVLKRIELDKILNAKVDDARIDTLFRQELLHDKPNRTNKVKIGF